MSNSVERHSLTCPSGVGRRLRCVPSLAAALSAGSRGLRSAGKFRDRH